MGDVVDLPERSGPAPATLRDLVRCVDRELGFRQRVYPRWVEQKKMNRDTADLELARMRSVRDRLLLGEAWHTVLTGIAEKAGVDAVSLQLLVRQAEAMTRSAFPDPAP